MNTGTLRTVLFDLDGTLYLGDRLIPGVLEALVALRARGLHLRFLTNTSTQTHAQLLKKVRGLGLPVAEEELVSAVDATRLFLGHKAAELGEPLRVWPVVAEEVRAEFSAFTLDVDRPHYIVLGDIGEAWSMALLNRLFHALSNGAELLAVHKNKFWQTPEGLHVDIGLFVAGLEYATGRPARILGKPSVDFFMTVLEPMGFEPAEALMVGDDIDSDVGGAQACGIAGVLVQTGKYRAEYAERSKVLPRFTLKSAADIAQLF